MIKVYKAEWYVNGKLITNTESGREFYSREKAVNDAECRKPETRDRLSSVRCVTRNMCGL